MKKQLRGSAYLVVTAFIWGMAFVAQSSAMDHVGPIAFTAGRAVITTVVLAILSPLITRLSGHRDNVPFKQYVKVGLPLGILLFGTTVFQQMGLVSTSPGKSGFITALYIIIVPLLGLFMKKKPGVKVWIGVVLGLVGLGLLTLKEGFRMEVGDLLTFACAIVGALHIVAVDRLADGMHPAKVCCAQFGFMAVIALICAFIFEGGNFAGLTSCTGSLLYVGVCSGAVGFTLQIAGQQYTEPTLASLLMCLESVFAVLGGWVILHQGLGDKELFGCALMLAGCVLAQLPDKRSA